MCFFPSAPLTCVPSTVFFLLSTKIFPFDLPVKQGGGLKGGLVGGELSKKITNPLFANIGDVEEIKGALTELFSPSSSLYLSLSSSMSKEKAGFVKGLLGREGVGVNVGAMIAWVKERERIWGAWYEGKDSKKLEASQCYSYDYDDDDNNNYVPKKKKISRSKKVARNRNQPQAWGWSKDPVMNRYVWCNAYRELDRGTRYFRGQIKRSLSVDVKAAQALNVEPKKHRLRSVLWSAFIYRRANNIDTWMALGGLPAYPYDEERRGGVRKMKERFAKVNESNEGFFARCHIDSGGMKKYKADIEFLMKVRKGGKQNLTNLECYADGVSKALEKGSTDDDRIKGVCEAINEMPGIGDFFAWQITCDLMESRVLTLGDGRVISSSSYCRLGPGAISGLERILTGRVGIGRGGILWRDEYCGGGVCGGRELSVHALTSALAEAFDAVMEVLGGKGGGQPRGVKMDAKNLEHSLCEFSKYCNIRENEKGAKKRHYEKRVGGGGCVVGCGEACGVDYYCVKCVDGFCSACKGGEGKLMEGGFYVCDGCLRVEEDGGVGTEEETKPK
ncbi:hypothetical protein TrRE_jg6842 [Triparma retinervis]|uniref:5-hmdU DNA kinase helical domain-containing protein n=1 Tax=Triparma retinervis TaxID=2557542 RepID=A0A9W7A2R0_9STRA|nr:hypothetical protein TrRE_jg6842 [Triparma retinervis]